ncbi:efflux RND transporter periplasmic adaptor subunit [Sphingobacterium humi]|uniref:HlyD family efflux transporter periplasmic adaptor subunit n=1 Tax=Sphingobacterium humi TaxID=1796905 RepID=A0A6N8KYE3_9SPHI|nr:efflux RND transporter periplasmic adaptor subunit [Sphingobacterium humi]MVZ62117.1 HlyD family efflux transporter periplasmic adaptor subunit [Sphingobacterium humi]
MKKIINNTYLYFILIALVCTSCKQKAAKETEKTSEQVLQEVKQVLAIGKVTSTEGIGIISSPNTGILQQINIKEGDSVKQGQVLMTLKEDTESLNLSQANTQLKSLQANRQQQVEELKKEQFQLENLEQKYQTSKRLYDKNAETKENVDNDYSSWRQQQQRVNAIKEQIAGAQLSEKEQQIAIAKDQKAIGNLQIVAPQTGIITLLNAKLGQSVSNAQELGEITNLKHLIIEAEVDELFADSIRINQTVSMSRVGNAQQIATGKVIYVSPVLTNKSILFETANEGEDRRVRKIIILPAEQQNLLLNGKVECRINL